MRCTMKNKFSKYFWLIPIISGLIICIYSVKVIPNKIKEEKTYIETTAIVVDYETCEFDDGNTGESYVVEYKIDRDSFRLTSNSCATIPKKLGKEVKIKYDPNDPSKAIFANDIGNYLIPVAGVIFLICGVILKRKNGND